MTISSPAAIAARLDRLPPSAPLWIWLACISFGAFFEVYETALTSLLAPMLVHAGVFQGGKGGAFGLPDLASFAFATFFGLFVGAILFSVIADRVGRRPIFTYSLVWYALATLAMAFQSKAAPICVWRFIASVGVGAEIVAVDAYISELMPKTMRGRGFAISKAIQYTAVPIAAILATVLAHKSVGGLAGWRLVLMAPVIGAVLIWWVRRSLPESPRWLAEHGRQAEADAVLDGIESKIRRSGAPLGPIETIHELIKPPQLGYAALFEGQLRRRTWMLILVSCMTTAAYFGFSNWLPSLLEARGLEVTKSLGYTAVIALSYPLSPFAFSFFADRLERKWQIAAGGVIVIIAGLLFSVQTVVAGWLVFGLMITLGNNLSSYGAHTYRSELFPTSLRARGIGLVYSIDRLMAAFNSYVIGFILVTWGVNGVMVYIVGACAVAIATVLLFGPRTLRLSTDAIENDPSRRLSERVA